MLGKFCQDYRAAHPQDLVIAHFVGASPGSTDVRRTLRWLCHELVTGAALTAEIPEDPEKLRVAFVEMLQQASAQKRVVILLDAINQFDSTTQLAGWSWLPEELPATARTILSTLSGPAMDSLRQRRRPPRSIELQPLDAPDREAIIREFLHRYRKTMTDDQLAALLAKADAGTPLYLLVALEELRTLGTYEEITDRITQLPPDTRTLFIWILKRLEDDDGFRDASGRKIGRELVSRVVSLLGASRHGLSQQELVELLSPGDPQGNVVALAQLLRPYLMQRGELLDFYHGQFREAAASYYLAAESQRLAAHGHLASLWCLVVFDVTTLRAPVLHRVGQRFFRKDYGVLRATSYDRLQNRLLVFFEDVSCAVLSGTPRDFLQGREHRQVLVNLPKHIEQVVAASDDRSLYVLSSNGSVTGVSLDTFLVEASLCPSIPIRSMADDLIVGNRVLLADGANRLYHCHLER